MSTPITEDRTKDRIKESNEVFTPPEAVERMLDDIEATQPCLFSNWEKTILEPTCGNGRFLTAILRRRLKYMADNLKGDKFYPLKALRTIYAFDIHASNVVEAREEMIKTVYRVSKELGNDGYARARSRESMMKILEKNIIRGDSAKILGTKEYHSAYDFDIPQPDPYAFAMEDKIKEEAAIQERPSKEELEEKKRLQRGLENRLLNET